MKSGTPEEFTKEFHKLDDGRFYRTDERIAMFDNGISELFFDIIKQFSHKPGYEMAVSQAWAIFSAILVPQNIDDERDYIPIEKFTAANGFQYIAENFQMLRDKHSVLLTLAWSATNDIATPAIISFGLHKVAIAEIKKGKASPDFDTCMSFLRTLTANPSTRNQLRADGALDAVLPSLDDLKAEKDDLALRRGFRAASIVARLAGNDEQGIGPQILRGNPVLIDKTLQIFDRVLDAGAGNDVINMVSKSYPLHCQCRGGTT